MKSEFFLKRVTLPKGLLEDIQTMIGRTGEWSSVSDFISSACRSEGNGG